MLLLAASVADYLGDAYWCRVAALRNHLRARWQAADAQRRGNHRGRTAKDSEGAGVRLAAAHEAEAQVVGVLVGHQHDQVADEVDVVDGLRPAAGGHAGADRARVLLPAL